jgi:L-2,4-diaminobutyrate decarboxylase
LVLFRCRRAGLSAAELDTLNIEVQRRLMATGQAAISRTRHDGQVALKFTFVNPLIGDDDVAALLKTITEAAEAI